MKGSFLITLVLFFFCSAVARADIDVCLPQNDADPVSHIPQFFFDMDPLQETPVAYKAGPKASKKTPARGNLSQALSVLTNQACFQRKISKVGDCAIALHDGLMSTVMDLRDSYPDGSVHTWSWAKMMHSLEIRHLAKPQPKVDSNADFEALARGKKEAFYVIKARGRHVYAVLKHEGKWYWAEAALRTSGPSRPWTVTPLRSPGEINQRVSSRFRDVYTPSQVWEITGTHQPALPNLASICSSKK